MARLNTSTAVVVNTDLEPFDELFTIESDGVTEQWYYENDGTYSPNWVNTPLTLIPSLTVYDKDTDTTYTPTFYLASWKVQMYVNGSWTEFVVTAAANAEHQYTGNEVFWKDGFNLKVGTNIANSQYGITVTCELTYIDPRDLNFTYTAEASILLTQNTDADIIYPEVRIVSPSAQRFNPLKDSIVTGTDISATGTMVNTSDSKGSVKSLKGRSVVWNQRIANGDFHNGTDYWVANSSQFSNVQVSNNVLSGTIGPSIGAINGINQQEVFTAGRKYFIRLSVKLDTTTSSYAYIKIESSGYDASYRFDTNVWIEKSIIREVTTSSNVNRLGLFLLHNGNGAGTYAIGDTLSFKNVQVFDLTQMFGAGKEPATVAEFEALFPLDYYDYNAGTMICGTQTGLKSVDAGGNDIATVSVPITQLKGRASGSSVSTVMFPDGLKGIGDVKDEIDFAAGKAIKRIESVDLGTVAFTKNSSWGAGVMFGSSSAIVDAKPAANDSALATLLCSKFSAKTKNQLYAGEEGLNINPMRFVQIVSASQSSLTAEQFQTAMSGVYLHYELDTPIEYDLDTALDTVHDVKAGGREIWLPDGGSNPVNTPLDWTGFYGSATQFAIECEVYYGGEKAFLIGEDLKYWEVNGDEWTENVEDGCIETPVQPTDVDYSKGCLIEYVDVQYDDQLSRNNTCRFKNGYLQVKTDLPFDEYYGLYIDYIRTGYTGTETVQEMYRKSIVIEWEARPTLYDLMVTVLWQTLHQEPYYVSGDGTKKVIVDAMFGDWIVVRVHVTDWPTCTRDSYAQATIAWDVPPIDCTVVSENGAAVRVDTEAMKFSTIVNTKDGVLSEEKKQEHLRFNWKSRPSTSSSQTDKGWGQECTIGGEELRVSSGGGGGAAGSTQVLFETHLLGPWQEMEYDDGDFLWGYTVTDSDGTTPIIARCL